MKRTFQLLTLLFLTLTLSKSVQAQDGFLSNAKTLQKGVASVAAQPVFLTAQDDFMLMVRGAYGIQSGVTGHLKLGLFDDETYFGAHFETALNQNSDSNVDFAALVGVYSYTDIGLKLGLNISTDLDPISIYSGINYQPLFANETINGITVPVGFDVHLDNGIDLILEGNIPANDDGEYLESISFGARFYLK